MKLKIDIENINKSYKIQKMRTKHLIENVCKREDYKRGDVSIVFVDHDYIVGLNKRFLGRNYTTDVISFSLDDNKIPDINGEIYINLDMVNENACEYNVSHEEEVNRMVIHGLLHLMGYDDQTKLDKSNMTKKEDFYLDKAMNKQSDKP